MCPKMGLGRVTAAGGAGAKYTSTQILMYTNTQIHKYTNTQIHKYTNTQIHKYTNKQINKVVCCAQTLGWGG